MKITPGEITNIIDGVMGLFYDSGEVKAGEVGGKKIWIVNDGKFTAKIMQFERDEPYNKGFQIAYPAETEVPKRFKGMLKRIKKVFQIAYPPERFEEMTEWIKDEIWASQLHLNAQIGNGNQLNKLKKDLPKKRRGDAIKRAALAFYILGQGQAKTRNIAALRSGSSLRTMKKYENDPELKEQLEYFSANREAAEKYRVKLNRVKNKNVVK